MSKSEAKRQQKLAKKKSKEREKRKVIVQRQQRLASLVGKMTEAAKGAIEGCYISTTCHDGTGIGTVLVVRRMSSGMYAFAVILIDSFCLGVKDAMGRFCSSAEMQKFMDHFNRNDPLEAAEPSAARGYVEAAIAYAHSLGLPPHPDYRKVAPIWGDVVPGTFPSKLVFGRGGKPCYVAGPHDDQGRQNVILQSLKNNVGESNFDFIIPIDSKSGLNLSEFTDNELDNNDLDDQDYDYQAYDENFDEGIVDGAVIRRIDDELT